jgi:hypothetical protein
VVAFYESVANLIRSRSHEYIAILPYIISLHELEAIVLQSFDFQQMHIIISRDDDSNFRCVNLKYTLSSNTIAAYQLYSRLPDQLYVLALYVSIVVNIDHYPSLVSYNRTKIYSILYV